MAGNAATWREQILAHFKRERLEYLRSPYIRKITTDKLRHIVFVPPPEVVSYEQMLSVVNQLMDQSAEDVERMEIK